MAPVVKIHPYGGKNRLSGIGNAMDVHDLGPLLLTWFNFNPCMDK